MAVRLMRESASCYRCLDHLKESCRRPRSYDKGEAMSRLGCALRSGRLGMGLRLVTTVEGWQTRSSYQSSGLGRGQ